MCCGCAEPRAIQTTATISTTLQQFGIDVLVRVCHVMDVVPPSRKLQATLSPGLALLRTLSQAGHRSGNSSRVGDVDQDASSPLVERPRRAPAGLARDCR